MKKDDVKIGSHYLAKVTNKVVSVRIDGENRYGGWDATNLATGKKVRIKSAQRLRGPAGRKAANVKSAEPDAAEKAGGRRLETEVTDRQEHVSQISSPQSTASGLKPPVSRLKRISAVDAAVQVLREARAPMRCQEMIDAMAERGLWTSPGGATPHATLYSAIQREIGKKGDGSRFRKAERGRFEAAEVEA